MRVPSGVPSVTHGSAPCSASWEQKKARSPTTVTLLAGGLKPGQSCDSPERLARISRVPAGVPSLVHRAPASEASSIGTTRK